MHWDVPLRFLYKQKSVHNLMDNCWEWERHPDHKKSFLAGYASIRSVPDYESVMPLLRLVRSLDTIGFTFKRGT